MDIKYHGTGADRQPLVGACSQPLLLVSLTVVLAMLAGLAGLTPPAQASAGSKGAEATTITLNPSPVTINGCEIVQVQVWINDVSNLYAADVQLSFDPSVLEVVDFDPGTPGVIELEPGGFLVPPLWTARNTADNVAGTIWYAATQLYPTPPAEGSGILFVIRFRAKAGATSSPLHFTYTALSNRDAEEIAATPADGSADTYPPASPMLSIARLNPTTAQLTWTSTSGIAEYHLYRDTAPYFTPVAPAYQATTALSYDDVGALGDVVIQYYYVVRSACATGFESSNSNRVGAYDYPLSSASTSNYADVAIVLINPTYNTAANLATYIGSSVRSVLRYNPATQTFQTYRVGFPFTNFSLSLGDFVFVVTDSTAPASVAIVGGVPDPGAVSFALVSGTPAKYNYLSLPLDQAVLVDASDVAASVGAGVTSIIKYETATQSYRTYRPSFPWTDFPLAIGEPFGLVLSPGAPSNWP